MLVNFFYESHWAKHISKVEGFDTIITKKIFGRKMVLDPKEPAIAANQFSQLPHSLPF